MYKPIILSLVLGAVFIFSSNGLEATSQIQTMVEDFNSTIDSLVSSIDKIKSKVTQMKSLISQSLGPDEQAERLNKVTTPSAPKVDDSATNSTEDGETPLTKGMGDLRDSVTRLQEKIQNMRKFLSEINPNATAPKAEAVEVKRSKRDSDDFYENLSSTWESFKEGFISITKTSGEAISDGFKTVGDTVVRSAKYLEDAIPLRI